ncbi:multidrug resistance-associated protein 1-like [Plakobranchus ocellatus]|uniref:Multidrug resistance-associated protein 1-like n=1 Tax=Plakobranchus ocellatus TaxID=259542 RepID=A0AAV4D2Q2_9GAST|nr:multidrug resistance-associated protein 1-like [Plakobranchus ocellatus]
MFLSRRSGVASPCIPFLFWLLTLVTKVVPFYTVIIQEVYKDEAMRFDMTILTFGLIVTEFVLQLIGDTSVRIMDASAYKQPCPIMWTSFFSKLTYSWVFEKVYQGYKKAVVMSDIFDAPGYMQCQHNVPAFMAAWDQELQKQPQNRDVTEPKRNINTSHHSVGCETNGNLFHITETTTVTSRSQTSTSHRQPKRNGGWQGSPSLVRALAKVFFLPLFKAQLVGLLADAVLYLNPILIGLLIKYIEEEDKHPKWEGYALAAAFFTVVLTSSILTSYRFYTCSNLGLRVKTVLSIAVYKKVRVKTVPATAVYKKVRKKTGLATAVSERSQYWRLLCKKVRVNTVLAATGYKKFGVKTVLASAVYKKVRMKTLLAATMYKKVKVNTVLTATGYKALTMNAETRRKFTVGNIVNLMSVDCHRFRDMTARLYVLISWPVQVSIAVYLLYDVLGVASLAGIVTLVLLIPTNVYTSTLLKRIQARQLTLKDQRIKLINEMLNGIKVIKLNAWEPSFQKKISGVRKKEVSLLRRAAVLTSVNTLCMLISPVLVTVVSFVAYVLITGESLTPTKAFVAMNIINIMKGPMDTLPYLISQLVQVPNLLFSRKVSALQIS